MRTEKYLTGKACRDRILLLPAQCENRFGDRGAPNGQRRVAAGTTQNDSLPGHHAHD